MRGSCTASESNEEGRQQCKGEQEEESGKERETERGEKWFEEARVSRSVRS